jgi:uncharacterized delta-60 repeat protein
MLLGGGFTAIGTVPRGYIARMLPSGQLDTLAFDPEANFPVYAIAIQADNKILIGGTFTALIPQTGKPGTPVSATSPVYNNPYGLQTVLPAPGTSATVPIYVNHVARLNTDGTLDTSFYPDPDSDILSIAVQSNGQIVVGGTQTSFAVNAATTGLVRNYIGRINADGSIDTAFNPDANALVNSVTLLANQHILVGGSFTTLQPNGAASPTYVDHLALLNPDGTLDTSLSVGANATMTGQVQAFAQQPNGQVIVAGSFGKIDGSQSPFYVRLNGDATIDTTYNSGVDGPVNAVAVLPNGASTQTPTNSGVWLNPSGLIRYSYSAASNGEIVCSALQADGKVLIGGLFSSFGGDTALQNLVRLNTDGSVDTTFAPVIGGVVSAIVIQADGKIVIGGGFTYVNAVNNAFLARLNADGTTDTTYAPQPNLQVLCLALQSDGKVVAGGDFTLMTPPNATVASSLNFLARLNTDGTIDTAFNPDLNGPAYCVALTSTGQILVGGAFTMITPNAGATAYNVQNFARLNADGTVDTKFYPDPNAPVASVAVLPNGQVLAAGTFTAWEQNANVTGVTPGNIVTSNYVTRVNTDGTVDTSFAPNPNGGLTTVVVQPNGQIVIGGSFSAISPNYAAIPLNRNNIARLNANGTADPSFDPSLNGTVDSILVLTDGSLFAGGSFTTIQVGGAALIGGSFGHVGGVSAPNLARLNFDGSFDSSFLANADGPVNTIVPASGGTLVGGSFAKVQGLAQANLARITAAGNLDSTFTPAVNGTVNAIAAQQNGQIVIGGSFTTVGGQNSPNLARIGPSGSPDAGFHPVINGTVDSVVVQPNGQIVIAGAFTGVSGQSTVGLARLNSDGSVDATFVPGANGTVNAVTLQLDGTFYVAGSFTEIGGQPFAYAAHLSASGAVDPAFNPATNSPVDALMVQPDGKVFIGGGFTAAGGVPRFGIARYAPSIPVSQAISVSSDQSTFTWMRGGSAPEFASVQFEETTDGTHWVTLGQATTADGATWQLTGAAPSGQSNILVRATGLTPSSQFASSGLVQVLYLAYSAASSPVVNSISAITGTSGTPLSFTVTATQSPKTFSASGLPPGLTINSKTGVISGTPTGTGTYAVTVTVGNAGGSVATGLTISIGSPDETRFAPVTTSSANRLLNLSTRAALTGNQVMIAGFAVEGTGTKQVLLRAVGPGLKAFNVPGTMATPEIQLYSSDGVLMNTNVGWGGGSTLSTAFAQVGAFALTSGSADSALLVTLNPGTYTVHVFDTNGKGGVALTEVYDASASPMTAPLRLMNISTRGTVSPGAGALIGGFVISGSSMKSVLIRGIGPGLSAFNVADAIADPVLSVFDENGTVVAQNTAWSNQSIVGSAQAAIQPQDIMNADSSVGAFVLSGLSADTALIANLPPGQYTFQVTSASNATGEALGEVYELP